MQCVLHLLKEKRTLNNQEVSDKTIILKQAFFFQTQSKAPCMSFYIFMLNVVKNAGKWGYEGMGRGHKSNDWLLGLFERLCQFCLFFFSQEEAKDEKEETELGSDAPKTGLVDATAGRQVSN